MARTIYIRCKYGIFGREITKYTVIYGVYIRFWPTVNIDIWQTDTGRSVAYRHVAHRCISYVTYGIWLGLARTV